MRSPVCWGNSPSSSPAAPPLFSVRLSQYGAPHPDTVYTFPVRDLALRVSNRSVHFSLELRFLRLTVTVSSSRISMCNNTTTIVVISLQSKSASTPVFLSCHVHLLFAMCVWPSAHSPSGGRASCRSSFWASSTLQSCGNLTASTLLLQADCILSKPYLPCIGT